LLLSDNEWKASGASALQQDAQHAAQRFRRTPEQLVAHGESTQVLVAHGQLVQAAHWHGQRAGHGSRREFTFGDLTLVGNHLHPVVGTGQQGLDVRHGHVLLELDRESLRVAAHGADAHAQAVDRDAARAAEGRVAQDLVALGAALPFFLALTVLDGYVDPGDQAAGQGRVAEVLGGEASPTAHREAETAKAHRG